MLFFVVFLDEHMHTEATAYSCKMLCRLSVCNTSLRALSSSGCKKRKELVKLLPHGKESNKRATQTHS